MLRVPFEFPKALYQSLTVYLLVAIGWHGGELMARQSPDELAIAGGLLVVGFFSNGIIVNYLHAVQFQRFGQYPLTVFTDSVEVDERDRSLVDE